MAILLTAAIAAAATLLLVFWRNAARIPKLDMPLVDLDGTATPDRYRAETTTLVAKGYSEYTKRGNPFCIQNLADPKRPIAVLPLNYLDEVKNAPQDKLSLPEYFDKLGQMKYTCGPSIAPAVQHVTRLDLNRALNDLIPALEKICVSECRKSFPPSADWAPIMPYGALLSMVVSIAARVLVGPALCDKWVPLTFNYLTPVLKATGDVKTKYRPSMRWMAKYLSPDIKLVRKYRREAAELLAPVIEARIAALEDEKSQAKARPQDAIQWLIEEHRAKGRKVTADTIAQNLLVMTVSSTHTTTATALWILYDLIDHPEATAEIREEISNTKEQHPSWTRQALGDLRLLDSFMTESMRVHSFAQTSVNRMVMAPWTFKDGLHLPAGFQLTFPTYRYSQDADVHADPAAFDAKRHLRKRQEIDPAKYHFASTADSLAWGSGPHACPGRYLVQDMLKLVFIQLVSGYELKWPEEGKRHPSPDTPSYLTIAPDVAMSVLVKEKAQ